MRIVIIFLLMSFPLCAMNNPNFDANFLEQLGIGLTTITTCAHNPLFILTLKEHMQALSLSTLNKLETDMLHAQTGLDEIMSSKEADDDITLYKPVQTSINIFLPLVQEAQRFKRRRLYMGIAFGTSAAALCVTAAYYFYMRWQEKEKDMHKPSNQAPGAL